MEEVFFLKEFKSLTDQLNLLKDRGLKIGDEEKAELYLLTNNYYNIINGYGKFFCSEKNKYDDDATFEKIAQLYFFDKEIKQILFSSILDVEKHLKSSIAHRFAERFQNQTYAYLNTNNYSSDKILEISNIVSKFSKIINTNKKFKNNSINHYVNNYSDVPIWVIIDYIEFGDLLTFIKNLDKSLQNDVAIDLVSFVLDNLKITQQFTPETMLGLLNNIRETRNVCAHNNRLIGFECRASSTYYSDLHSLFNITPDDSRKNVFTTFISLQCFLSNSEYAKLHNSIRKRVNQLKNKVGQDKVNEILEQLGFPINWNDQPKLRQ